MKAQTIPSTMILLFAFFSAYVQVGEALSKREMDTNRTFTMIEEMPDTLTAIQFNETQSGIATDSFAHNLGAIGPVDLQIVKHFKYVGDESVFISNIWTREPGAICDYPTVKLVKGELYQFTVCFTFTAANGNINIPIGFNLSNGEKVKFVFKGQVVSGNPGK